MLLVVAEVQFLLIRASTNNIGNSDNGYLAKIRKIEKLAKGFVFRMIRPDSHNPFFWYSTRYKQSGNRYRECNGRRANDRCTQQRHCEPLARLPLGSLQLIQLPCGKQSQLEQTLRMLVSIQTGMFLEPHSQIVAKEVVLAVKMDLSIEKVRSIGEADSVAEGNRISKLGDACEWLAVK